MKLHLKRITSPRTWFISRKKEHFIIRPKPSGHAFSLGLPLGVIIRDLLSLASTCSEAKKLLHHQPVLVDGRRRKDPHFLVGLFDVLELPGLKKAYRMVLDRRGRMSLVAAPEGEKDFKPCKIIGKKVLPEGKIQFNLHDGKNVLLKENARVGDTLLLALPKLELSKVLPLQPGVKVFLTRGKHGGELGELKELRGDEAVYKVGREEIETARSYLFVVGEKEAVISFGIPDEGKGESKGEGKGESKRESKRESRAESKGEGKGESHGEGRGASRKPEIARERRK